MGLLSTLAKIGGVVAAPFSGGASLALTGLGSVGDVIGGQQKGAAQGQMTQAQLQQGQDRNATDLYQAQQTAQNQAAQTDLQRKQFESTNRGSTAKQALLASLLGGGYQGANVSVPGIQNASVSGGLLDSLKNNPGAMAAMAKLAQQAGTAQDTPLQFQGGQQIQAPTMTSLPQESKGNNIMDIIARIAQIGGAVGSAMPPKGGG